jgi:arylsulfatase A-like enzyme
LTSLIDIAPTLLAAAGDDAAGQPLQGVAARDGVYGQFQTGELGLYMAMTPRWKYVYSAADRREYLFDRVRDPQETASVAYNTYCRDALLSMRERAAVHFAELDKTDFDAATDNVPLSLGGADEAATLPAIARDPDAGFLVIPDDDLVPNDEFASYRSRYRDGGKP